MRSILRLLFGEEDRSDERPVLWLAMILLCGWFGALVVRAKFVFGSPEGNWVYPYFEAPGAIPFWLPVVVIGLLYGATAVSVRTIQAFSIATLTGLFITGCAVQFLIYSVYPVPVEAIIKSDYSNSFYSASSRVGAVELLSGYDKLVERLPLHARSNMPGKVLFYHFLGQFSLSPRFLAAMIMVTSNLGAFFVYGLCTRIFEDRLTGVYAFLLYILVPCKLWFFPILNTVTPVFILCCLFLFLQFFYARRGLYLWLLGVCLYVLFLFEPSPLVTGIVFLGIWWHKIRQGSSQPADAVSIIAYPVCAFLLAHAVIYACWSFNIFSAFRYILTDAVDFNVKDARPYHIWLVQNLREFLVGAGIPAMVVGALGLGRMLLEWAERRRPPGQISLGETYLLSLWATLLVLSLLGINRGEVTRLWIYLAAFFQVPAAAYCAKHRYFGGFFLLLVLTASEAAICLSRVAYVMPD